MIANKNIKIFCFMLFVFGFIVYAYSPVFYQQFGYHNDYRIWEYYPRAGLLGYPETRHLIGIGRPILAVLLNVHLMLVSNLFSLHVAQIFSVLSISVVATLYYLYLQKQLNIHQASAALLAVLTFTLPSMAINSFWVTNYTSEIIPLLIAFMAYVLVQKSMIDTSHQRMRLVIAAVLLYLDLLIYPPSTFFFLTLSFVKLLFGPKKLEEAQLKYILTEVMMLLVVCALYYVSIKFVLKPYFLKHPLFLHASLGGYNWQEYYQIIDASFPQYTLKLGLDPMSKFLQAKDYVILVISAWFHPLRLRWIILLLGCFLGILAWSASSSAYIKGLVNDKRVVLGTGLLILLAVLTALPCLAGPSSYAINYRVVFSSMALVPAIIVYAIDRAVFHSHHQKVVYTVLLFTGLFVLLTQMISLHRLTLVVQRASDEYRWVSTCLTEKITNQTKAIEIQQSMAKLSEPLYLYADFGLNASDIGIAGIVKAALHEMKRDPAHYQVSFKNTRKRAKDPGLLVCTSAIQHHL